MKLQVVALTLCLWILTLANDSQQTQTNIDLEDGAQQEGESSSKPQQQEGSWSHWWSYDGISGPDYWNINKRWRLCSLGRKQSPVEISTDRLVYDHLLGPLHLSWLPGGLTNLEDPSDSEFNDESKKSQRAKEVDANLQRPVKVQLLNSGRGLEVWLEAGLGAPKKPVAELNQQDQLILSRGPLSYSYKLFKIELHSAAPSGGVGITGASGVKSSEHLIDGRAFDGELQLHFYNKHLASSASEAQQLANEDVRGPNLFATIGVFLSATNQHQTVPLRKGSHLKFQKRNVTNSAIDFILDNLSSLQIEGASMQLELSRNHIESLVTSRQHYVTYQGSLNRPPCAETVDWILLNKALRVDADKFQSLFERLNTNQENIRPVKPLNRRLLRTSINILMPDSGNRLSGNEDELAKELDELQNEMSPDRGNDTTCTHKNCSNPGDNLQTLDKSRSKSGIGTCSMRPRYVYQLSELALSNNKLEK